MRFWLNRSTLLGLPLLGLVLGSGEASGQSRIDQLGAGAAVSSTDSVPNCQGCGAATAAVKTTMAQILTWIQTNVLVAAQFPALTGDVTTVAGALATTIAANAVTTGKINAGAVTYAKIQNEGASTLLGNPTGSPAAPSEITLGTNLSFAGSVLNAAGGGGTPVVYVGATAGSVNAYTIASPTPASPAFTLTDQYIVCGSISTTNTGASTLNVNSTGATAIKKQTPAGLAALSGGELVGSNTQYCFQYNATGTAFVLLTTLGSGVTSGATSTTVTQAQWDYGQTFVVNTASQTLTLPVATSLSPNGGIVVVTVGQAVTLAPNSADGINGGTINTSVSIPANLVTLVTTTGSSGTGAFNVALGFVAGANITLTPNANGTTSIAGSASGVTSISPGVGTATSLTDGQSAITTTGTIYASPSAFPFYLGGLTLSNDGGSPNTVIDISAGAATSDDSTVISKLAAFTKTLGSWALGTGNGCLDTGSVANATWYHVFVIERTDTGVVDVLCSTSAGSPTFPASYTKKRRIGSLFTCDTIVCAAASTNIAQYTQRGSTFWWKNLQTGVAPDITTTTLGTSSALFTMAHVPPGIVVQPICRYTIANTGNSVILTSPDEADVAPTTATPFGATGSPGWDQLDTTLTSGDQNSGCPLITTNTSQQIRARASAATTTLQVVVRGWVD